jgi:hypothetical protein
MREMEKQELASWLRHPGQTLHSAHAGELAPSGPVPHGPAGQRVERQSASAQWEPAGREPNPADDVGHTIDTRTESGCEGPASTPPVRVKDVAAVSARSADPGASLVEDADMLAMARPGSTEVARPLPVAYFRAAVQPVGLASGQTGHGWPAAPGTDPAVAQTGLLQAAAGEEPGPILRAAEPADPAGRLGATSLPRLADATSEAPRETEDVGQAEETSPVDEPERQGASGPAQDGEQAPAVRVHTFWTDQSVRIWIGTDRSAALDPHQLAQAAADVSRLLGQQGAAVESLTVNGETVIHGGNDAGARTDEIGEPVTNQPYPRRAGRTPREK